MPPEPVPADPGRDKTPARSVAEPEGPWWEDDEAEDPSEGYAFAQVLAECREIAEDRARADANAARADATAALGAVAALAGRRGPGQPGSAEIFPGEYPGRAAQFASGMLMDTMPGGPELARFADEAAGPGDRFDGVSDDELLGLVSAWDRVAAHATARKYAAIAEVARRRPAAGSAAADAGMPDAWDEFTARELCAVLAESRSAAADMLGLAYELEVMLPGTKAAFEAGILDEAKVEIIARAVAVLTPGEARAAEALVLDRAGRLTPGGLRSAIARAVIEVAPDKARKRREQAARDARVERWPEASGNAGLAGRELPPAQVLAADQKITALARLLKKSGLEGSMDELRARAYLDLLLGTDSRPRAEGAARQDTTGGPGDGGTAPGTPVVGAVPAGFAGTANLTVPLTTLLKLAERPGEIPGIGPIDPALARDLARAAAQNPKTTWCVTVTDEHGHAIGHGCARPEPKGHSRHHEKPKNHGSPDGRDPPRGTGPQAGSGFAFTGTGEPGPPDGYGSWRLSTGTPGQPDLIVTLDPITTEDCDHRYQARGHDPGVKLRHLTEIRHATCTGPACRRPATQCDYEHNVPYESGGRTCLCNGGPKCRHDHRLKQHPRWKVDQLPDGTFRWTTPSGRQYTAEPTRYPI
jgi:Domain of unknown function (DUF222)